MRGSARELLGPKCDQKRTQICSEVTSRAAASAAMKDMRIDGTADVKEVTVIGDWAWARTHLSITVTTPDGKEMRRSGYTLSIFFKDMDSIWRIARDANLLRAEPPTS